MRAKRSSSASLSVARIGRTLTSGKLGISRACIALTVPAGGPMPQGRQPDAGCGHPHPASDH